MAAECGYTAPRRMAHRLIQRSEEVALIGLNWLPIAQRGNRASHARNVLGRVAVSAHPGSVHLQVFCWHAVSGQVGQDIAYNLCHTANEAAFADVYPLMDSRHAAENRPVPHSYVAGQLRALHDDHVIPDDTVMPNVDLAHDQTVGSDARRCRSR